MGWPRTYELSNQLIFQSIKTLICWPVSFNLQNVKAVWLDRCRTCRSRAYDLDQVAIIRVARTWCRTPINGCHRTMPSICPWGRTKKIGDAPEHVSFASDHQAACWTPIKAATAWYKVIDLEGPIISRVHRTRTLWPRRHGQPPTIGPPEHNDEHGWSTNAQPTGR